METLLDGKGRGYVAEIDSDNKLAVASTSVAKISFVSAENGDAYRIPTSFLPVTTTNGFMFYFKNTSGTQHFHITKFLISWNGGSTNYNRPVEVELHGGIAAPTANHTAITGVGLNSTLVKTPSLDSYEWDGVGTGMTVAAPGTITGRGILAIGLTAIESSGAVIVGNNGSLGLYARGIETGSFSVTLEGYYETN